MIDLKMRQSIWQMYQAGMPMRQIASMFNIDRKTVKKIIKQRGEPPASERGDKISLDEDHLKEIFKECQGRVERVCEKLENEGVDIGYSTLTRRVRELGLRDRKKERAQRVPDIPGEEFQHDTSPYNIWVGGVKMKLQASLIYYRYSKVRYLRFYISFTRFHMKCFFHEALTYFGYVPRTCIIDNTNLAVKEGTGKNAIFNIEMVAFAKIYGFCWMAHEVKHSDRKAGVERGFWTVETNFFPGREFESLEDLNRQALEWCEKCTQTPNKKTKLVPIEQFELEKSDLKKLSPHLPKPYRLHNRKVDQYGYIAFEGNSYWIPHGTKREVTVLQYYENIQIYNGKKMVVEYDLPPFGTKSLNFSPKDVKPAHRPKKKTISCEMEETQLRSLGERCEVYLEGALKTCSKNKKYKAIRSLFLLHKRLNTDLFMKAIERSIKHGIYDVDRLEAIATCILKNDDLKTPEVEISQEYENRESYLQGEFTTPPELESYAEKYNQGNNNEKS